MYTVEIQAEEIPYIHYSYCLADVIVVVTVALPSLSCIAEPSFNFTQQYFNGLSLALSHNILA